MNNMVELDESTFDAFIAGDLPALVDIWGEDCAICQAIAPVVEQIAEKYAGRLSVASFKAEQTDPIVDRLGLRGIPTLILFKAGQERLRLIGFHSRTEIEGQLTPHLD